MVSAPDPGRSTDIQERVTALVSVMTLEEKISQMVFDAPAIGRQGIPKYDWWNECLHGVSRAGVATVFPQAIGLAIRWFSFTSATAMPENGHKALNYIHFRDLLNLVSWMRRCGMWFSQAQLR